jgi:hypothetical protein
VEVDRDTDVIGDDANPVPNCRAPAGAAKIEDSVLFGKFRDHNVRAIEQRAKAALDRAGGLATQTLTAGIHHGLPRDRGTHDRG